MSEYTVVLHEIDYACPAYSLLTAQAKKHGAIKDNPGQVSFQKAAFLSPEPILRMNETTTNTSLLMICSKLKLKMRTQTKLKRGLAEIKMSRE